MLQKVPERSYVKNNSSEMVAVCSCHTQRTESQILVIRLHNFQTRFRQRTCYSEEGPSTRSSQAVSVESRTLW